MPTPSRPLRAVFMGSPEFAVPSLAVVARRCTLVGVVCQPDRPAGRGRTLTAGPVKAAALPLGVPILQPTKMKDGTLLAALAELQPDVAIVVAFGRILPPPILELPALGCINVHASLLPRWRGAAPIQRAILAGDAETGVAIMQMDVGLDTGAVHRIARTAIGEHETQAQLFERLSHVGAEALDGFLADFPDVPAPVPQSEDGIVHAPPLTKDEGAIVWSRSARALVDHVRGMDPWPSATCRRGDAVLKVFGATRSSREGGGNPGEVIAVDAAGAHVVCGDGVVCLAEIQPPGRTRMPARAYATGNAFAPGECLG